MYSFKQYFLIIENRLDYLKRTMSSIDSSHDSLAKHRDPGDIVDHFANNADPTSNKQYTQWIVNKYNKQQFRQEDAPRIRDALSNFDRHKSKLEHKDINKYPSLNHLEDSIEPHVQRQAADQQRDKELLEKGSTLIHSENGLTVHKLNDMNGAMIYGRGTKWCTAKTGVTRATEKGGIDGHIIQAHYENEDKGGYGEDRPSHYTIKDNDGNIGKYENDDVSIIHNNAFHSYNDDGPLYVINTPDKQKYQYHPQSGQFMDRKDEPADIPKLLEKHPEIKNVEEFKDTNHLFWDKEEFEKKAGDHIKKTDLNFGAYELGATKQHIFNSPHLTPEHIDIITDRIAHDTAHGILSSGASMTNLLDTKALKMMSHEQKTKIADAIDKDPTDFFGDDYRKSMKRKLFYD